jgi:Transposase IS4
MASRPKRSLRDEEIMDYLDESEDEFDESEVESEASGDGEASECGGDSESDQSEDISDVENEGGGDATSDGWRKWKTGDQQFNKIPYSCVNPGYQVPQQRPVTELDFFQLFFTDELLQEIVVETNRYAAEKIHKETPLRKQSIWQTWTDVSLEEMKAFFGVTMNMALHDNCSLKEYFSEEWTDKQPFFKSIFSRTRYLQIYWALHINPPPAQPTAGVSTRGHKVKRVVDYIDEKCRENFVPGEKIAIDESTVAFKGRILFKMYNPAKPTKWGLRVYVLADSETGYVSVLVPYYGSPTTASLVRPDLPFTSRITLHLCQKLLQSSNGTGFHLYTDRFYTGVDLGKELLKIGIHTTGTIMANRKGLPAAIKQNKKLKLPKHDVLGFRKDDEMMALAWKDKRNVFVYSTYHNIDTAPVSRKVTRGEQEDFMKPVAIIDYTQHMGAVDRADHYCASYGFTRKSLKCKMLFWLLEVGIVNSFILHNIQREMDGKKKVTHLQYRKALLVQLVGDVRNKNALRRGRPSTASKEERLDGKSHFIMLRPNSRTKDCSVCSNRKIKGGRRETVYFCETCERKPGLHPGDCFKKYHTEVNYK